MSFYNPIITKVERRGGGMYPHRTAEEQRRSGMMETITTMNVNCAVDYATLEARIVASMSNEDMVRAGVVFGEGEMCPTCIIVKREKQHDPMTNTRHVCPICRTVWPGSEPWNRRREAVMATRAKREACT